MHHNSVFTLVSILDIAFRVINYSELFQIAGIDTCKEKNTSHGLCENLLVLKEKGTTQSRKRKS